MKIVLSTWTHKVTFSNDDDEAFADEVLLNFCNLMVAAGYGVESVLSSLGQVEEELSGAYRTLG